MKQRINDYITPLTQLIDLSINEGIFSNELEIAKVNPVNKYDNEQSIIDHSFNYFIVFVQYFQLSSIIPHNYLYN